LDPVKPGAVDLETQQAARQNLVDWAKQQAALWRPSGPETAGGPAGGDREGWGGGQGDDRSRDEMVPLAPGEWPRSATGGGAARGDDGESPVGDRSGDVPPWGLSPQRRAEEWRSGEASGIPASEVPAGEVPAGAVPSGNLAPGAETDGRGFGPRTEGAASGVGPGGAESGLVSRGATAEGGAADGSEARPLPPRLPAHVRAMQIHDAYLVVETAEGLQVVDQHALHERILYEHLRKRVLEAGVETQRLLIPVPVDLTAPQVAAVLEHARLLESFGVQVQEFSGQTVLLTGYPVMLKRVDPAVLLKDLAEQILETGRDPSRRDLLDSLLHRMSCKAAVKAGQRLTPEEIESLLAQRHLIDDAHHCPHGRPTALVLSRSELDRQFGRLG